MARRRFWSGFAAGAAAGSIAGLGSWLISKKLGRQEYGQILRLEKSVQVGRPIEEVFQAWADLQNLPQHIRMIERIDLQGKNSHWVINVGGYRVEWDAKKTQHVDHEALGWKSVGGPKHTGRINFARLGNDTMVHVVMNYAPAAGSIASGIAEAIGRIDGVLEQALRDFKASLEGKGQQNADRLRGTGTYGGYGSAGAERSGGGMNAVPAIEASSRGDVSKHGGELSNPVDYTSPAKPRR